MRWYNFGILVFIAFTGIVLQITVGQLLWFRTDVGWVGPELLAAVAVFLALYATNATDAALSGWILGFTVDLTISGPGMGLLALLYAAGCLGIFRIREVFYREKILTRIVIGFVFCAFVYELWTLYDVLVCRRASGGYFRPVLQAIGLAIYTALLTPLVCAVLGRLRRFLLPAPPIRQRR
ncbi:MAG: hypothetical protein SVV80_03665 [Planctomycetota bacterium]|nr:hypothetical protein [Planctomycetota bacterium]